MKLAVLFQNMHISVIYVLKCYAFTNANPSASGDLHPTPPYGASSRDPTGDPRPFKGRLPIQVVTGPSVD